MQEREWTCTQTVVRACVPLADLALYLYSFGLQDVNAPDLGDHARSNIPLVRDYVRHKQFDIRWCCIHQAPVAKGQLLLQG